MLNFLRGIVRADSAAAHEVDVVDAHRRSVAGALLIDVREPDEWRHGHALGARHIPLGRLGAELSGLPRDREVLFICRSGRRSAAAAAAARRAGLANAVNVCGGMLAWIQAGLPIAPGG